MTWGGGYGTTPWGGRSIALYEKFTKVPVVLLEIHLPRCKHTYGTSPCTAAVDTAGFTQKCYNTHPTCQDKAHFEQADDPNIIRFTMVDGPILPGIQAYRCLAEVSQLPSVIDEARGLGGVGQITATLHDFEDLIDMEDPYRTERLKIQGDFFKKNVTRNLNYRRKPMILRTGFLDHDGTLNVGAMRAQRYNLMDIPIEANGSSRVQVIGQDVLGNFQGLQIPPATTGQLLTAIDSSQLTLEMREGDGDQYAAPFGEPTTANPVYIRIGNEIIRAIGRAGDVFDLDIRGAFGSTPPVAGHQAGTKIQIGWGVTATRADEVLIFLLRFCGISDALIDLTGIRAEADRWLTTHLYTFCITRPEAAMTLFRELLQMANCYAWWDATRQKVRVRQIRPVSPDETTTEVLGQQFTSKPVLTRDEHAQRVSRCIVYFGIQDFSLNWRDKELTDSIYKKGEAFIDAEGESADSFDEEAPIEVFGWAMPEDLAAEVLSLSYRVVSRMMSPPKRIAFQLEAGTGYTIQPGDILDLLTKDVQNEHGEARAMDVLVLSKAQERNGGIRYDFEARDTGFRDLWGFYNENSGVPSFSSATDEQKRLAFYAEASGLMPDGTRGYSYP